MCFCASEICLSNFFAFFPLLFLPLYISSHSWQTYVRMSSFPLEALVFCGLAINNGGQKSSGALSWHWLQKSPRTVNKFSTRRVKLFVNNLMEWLIMTCVVLSFHLKLLSCGLQLCKELENDNWLFKSTVSWKSKIFSIKDFKDFNDQIPVCHRQRDIVR